MARTSRQTAALAALAASLAFVLPAAAQAQAPVACDQVVSGSFGDADDALAPGQTLCVRGTVADDIWIDTPGITVTSEPGQTGTIRGQVVVGPDASGVTVSDLSLDGSGLTYPGQIILGDDATFARNDITNRRSPAICLIIGALGHDTGAEARNARLVGNKIHDCGGTSDNHRHGVYVENADGTQIIGNDIYDNADRAVQLYPRAMNSVVAGNVIDGNGEGIIFGGSGSSSSSGNVVRNNVVSNPRLRAGIESWWDDAQPGTGNVAKDNCVFGDDEMVDTAGGGFTADNNLELDPLYVDRGAKNFTLRADSPCAAILAAGRSGTTARLAAPRSAVAPAAVQASDPLKVAVKRDGGTVSVTVKLARKPTARSFARVEVRQGGGRWRSIGVRAISAQRSITFRTKVAKDRKIAVRATLLGSAKKTFRR